eukprot:1812954-Pleurochrysis_carterae.AAC.1
MVAYTSLGCPTAAKSSVPCCPGTDVGSWWQCPMRSGTSYIRPTCLTLKVSLLTSTFHPHSSPFRPSTPKHWKTQK